MVAGLLGAACGAASTPTPVPVSTPVATTTPASAAAPTASPTPTPAPTLTAAPATAGPPDQGVHVSGTETVLAVTKAGTATTVNGVEEIRGLVATTVDATSDPRVSGTGTVGGNYDRWALGATQWGTYLLENEGGSWEGTWAGIAYPGAGPAPG